MISRAYQFNTSLSRSFLAKFMSARVQHGAERSGRPRTGICRAWAGSRDLFETARRSASFGANSGKMAVADVVLLLEYNVDLIPIDGPQILASSAAPVKHIGKDAAGHKFHHFALLQRGVISESQKLLLELMHGSCTASLRRALLLQSFAL